MRIEGVRLEWKPQDPWIGAFWKSSLRVVERTYHVVRRVDVWVCLLPCLPIHIVAWSGEFWNPNVPRLPAPENAPQEERS